MTTNSPSRRARRASASSAAEAETPARQTAASWDLARAAELLPQPTITDNKYRRGVLGLRTGSATYPGAAVLGTEAAWRTGVGLVRFASALESTAPRFGLPTPAAAVLSARPETVFIVSDEETGAPTDAWVIGSGTDPQSRSEAEQNALLNLLRGHAPVVVDAGALDLSLVDRDPADDDNPPAERAPRILTPHHGEFVSLWQAAGLGSRPPGWPDRRRAIRNRIPDCATLESAARTLAAHLDATVMVKGSTTVVATPGGFVFVCGPATPWLATAGTGDVLAGILGALVATHADAVRTDPELLGPLGATAAVVHDAAARRASGDPLVTSDDADPGERRLHGGPITALDVAHALPATIAALRAVAA